jgi:hypothetical protein
MAKAAQETRRIAMGTGILIIALVIEAAFATYCIIARASHRNVRSAIWIGASALVSAIQWGSRWYGLGALLLVWAALGAWILGGTRIQAAFAPYRMAVRASHEKLGSIVRIGAFAVLAVVTLVSAIEWRTHWHALAALLLVWAALGAWMLSRKQAKKEYTTWHSVGNAITTLSLVAIAGFLLL